MPFHGGGKGFGYLPHSNNTAEPAPFKGPVFSCPFSCMQTCARFRPCLRPDGLYGPDVEYGLVRHDQRAAVCARIKKGFQFPGVLWVSGILGL